MIIRLTLFPIVWISWVTLRLVVSQTISLMLLFGSVLQKLEENKELNPTLHALDIESA